MKRFCLFLPITFLLFSCAQMFDANLYDSFDNPPPLDTAALAKKSTSEIRQLADDPSFYQQLKDDPAALAAVQTALGTAFTDATTTQAKMDAATTMIEVTANGSSVAEIKNNAINNISSIADDIKNGNYAAAMKVFVGNKSVAEITATLTNLVLMGDVLNAMQVVAIDGAGKVDTDVFFSGTSDPAAFAQTALMAAVAYALVKDNTSIANTATELAKATPVLTESGPYMVKFNSAKTSQMTVLAATVPATSYSYAYMSALTAKLPLPI